MAIAKFDREEVILKTIDLFWKYGYSATSMQMIFKQTGLKPGSVYNTFGNKEELFKEALEYYTSKALHTMCHIIENAESVGEGICRVLEGFIKDSLKKDYSSCFLIKTQMELAKENKELYGFATEKLNQQEEVLRKYIAQQWGEEESYNKAVCVTLNMFGLRVYGYNTKKTDVLRDALKSNLQWLPWSD